MNNNNMDNYQHILFTRKPAEYWVEAYPLGNGRMGAMVYGGICQELISLNEDTLWSGVPVSDTIDGYYDHYMETRRLVDEEKFAEANNYASENLNTVRCDSASYQPAGDLILEFAGLDKNADSVDYKRTLDLRTGQCVTECANEKQNFKRTVFASYPDSVIVVRLESREKMDCKIALNTQMDGFFSADQQTVTFVGTMPYKNRNNNLIRVSQDGETGLRYCIKCRVISCNGI